MKTNTSAQIAHMLLIYSIIWRTTWQETMALYWCVNFLLMGVSTQPITGHHYQDTRHGVNKLSNSSDTEDEGEPAE